MCDSRAHKESLYKHIRYNGWMTDAPLIKPLFTTDTNSSHTQHLGCCNDTSF